MLIEEYFQQFAKLLSDFPYVQHSDISYQARRPALGFIRGDVHLRDGSVLYVREFVDVEHQIDRLTYANQYMSSSGQIIFRYDNTDHHRKLNLPTQPHHKHDGSESKISESYVRNLADVLQEIERTIRAV